MLGLFGSPFYSSPFETSWGQAEARMINLMNTLFNDDDEFGFSSASEDEHEEKKKGGKKEEAPKQTETSKTFSSIKRSFMNGPHMIEEVRERSVDSAKGEKREVTTRRLGNKWVQIESVTDKDGNKNTTERWHNVSEKQEEEFKKKWEEHRGKFGFESLNDETDTKAIKKKK